MSDNIQAEFDAFKQKVREVALEVQASEGWCDSGFNRVMEQLGLPTKKRFDLQLQVKTQPQNPVVSRSYRYTVLDAETEEEAVARVTREMVEREYVPSGRDLVEFRVIPPEPLRPDIAYGTRVWEGQTQYTNTSMPCGDSTCDMCWKPLSPLQEEVRVYKAWADAYGGSTEKEYAARAEKALADQLATASS